MKTTRKIPNNPGHPESERKKVEKKIENLEKMIRDGWKIYLMWTGEGETIIVLKKKVDTRNRKYRF